MITTTLIDLIRSFLGILFSVYQDYLNKPKITVKYEIGRKHQLYIANKWKNPITIRKIILLDIEGKERIIKTPETEDLPYRLEWYTGKAIEIPSLAIKIDPLYNDPREIIVEDAIWGRVSLKLNPKDHPSFFRN